MTDMKKQRVGILLFLAFVLAGLEAEAGKVTTIDNQVYVTTPGGIRFKKTTGEYIITLAAGGTEMPLLKDRVKSVEADQPAQYAQAVQAVTTGNLEQAIPMLEEMAIACFMLSPWDAKIQDMLGYAYSKKGDTAKAAAAYKKLLTTAAPATILPDMQKRAWNALIAVNDPFLVKSLEEAIAKGSRDNAAAAHIARADMAKAQGNKADALMDYLRVVVLYEQVKTVQPEALYKTGKCLEELRDPRAEDWLKKLKQDWPQSEWASKQ